MDFAWVPYATQEERDEMKNFGLKRDVKLWMDIKGLEAEMESISQIVDTRSEVRWVKEQLIELIYYLDRLVALKEAKECVGERRSASGYRYFREDE